MPAVASPGATTRKQLASRRGVTLERDLGAETLAQRGKGRDLAE